jgi:hypothetical protein
MDLPDSNRLVIGQHCVQVAGAVPGLQSNFREGNLPFRRVRRHAASWHLLWQPSEEVCRAKPLYIPVTMDSEGSEGSEGESPRLTHTKEDEAREDSIEPEPEMLGRGRRVRKAKRFFDELEDRG